MAYKGLGRGLDALLADNTTTQQQSGVTVLRISDIEPNLKQVRKQFDAESIDELANSIKENGLIQPIVVRRKTNGFYEIIAGERRWRACKAAGLTEVPVIIKDSDDKAASLIALVENLQREDLNPVEEAMGYKNMMDQFGLTQDETAKKVGKSRPAIANIMRILVLPEKVLEKIKEGTLSYGHARTLIPLVEKTNENEIFALTERIINEGLSVRETEAIVKTLLNPVEKPMQSKVKNTYYQMLSSKASSKLGRKLTINESKDGKGKVTLAYSSAEDLETLIKTLCGNTFFDENI